MSNISTIRLGVIGLGNIAKQHISLIQQKAVAGCVLSAVCSRTCGEFSEQLGVPHFVDYRALIDSRLCDAVLIATPSFSHYEIGVAALEAGLHVLMEKPIGISVFEGERLLALQPPATVFGLMLNQRTDPLFVVMRDHINGHGLGKLTRFSWTMTNWFRPEIYFRASEWRATWRGEGGGLLVNQCIHNLDIFQWLTGMPVSIRAHCAFGKYHNIEVEDEVTCFLKFSGGATGTFIASTGEVPGANRLEIVGDRGYLYFDGNRLVHGENDCGANEYSRSTKDMFGVPNTVVTDITPDRNVNQHAMIIENFCQAVLSNTPLIAPAEEGLHSLALANAMMVSTWQDRTVEIPVDSQQYQVLLNDHIKRSQFRKKIEEGVSVDMAKSYR